GPRRPGRRLQRVPRLARHRRLTLALWYAPRARPSADPRGAQPEPSTCPRTHVKDRALQRGIRPRRLGVGPSGLRLRERLMAAREGQAVLAAMLQTTTVDLF